MLRSSAGVLHGGVVSAVAVPPFLPKAGASPRVLWVSRRAASDGPHSLQKRKVGIVCQNQPFNLAVLSIIKVKTLILTIIATAIISISLHAKPKFRARQASAAHRPVSAEHSAPTAYRVFPIVRVNPTRGVMPSPTPVAAATLVVAATPTAEIDPASKPEHFAALMGAIPYFAAVIATACHRFI
jgi:hypothetical protein